MTLTAALLALFLAALTIDVLADKLAARVRNADLQHRINRWRWPAKGA